MKPEKQISYAEDPVAWAAQRDERDKYHESLFHPVYDLTKDIPMEWLIPEFLPLGYLCVLAAEPKEGKTCLATALALAVSTGTPFAGMPAHQHAVLWLSLEEGSHERRLILQGCPFVDEHTPYYTCFQPLAIDTDEGIAALEFWLSETDAKLVVVDPLHGAHSGRSLADGWAARRTLMKLKDFCARHAVTALVLHHAKYAGQRDRPRRIAENAQLSATASMEMILHQRDLREEEARAVHASLSSGVTGSATLGEAKGEGSARDTLSPGGRRSRRGRERGPVNEENRGEGDSKMGGLRAFRPRLITLNMRGRGPFANQTVHFLSRGPLDFKRLDFFQIADLPEHDDTTRVQRQILKMLESGNQTSARIIEETYI